MPFRYIERVEIVEVSFDFSIVFDGISERHEDVFDSLPHEGDGVQMSWPQTPAGHRYVDRVAFNARRFN